MTSPEETQPYNEMDNTHTETKAQKPSPEVLSPSVCDDHSNPEDEEDSEDGKVSPSQDIASDPTNILRPMRPQKPPPSIHDRPLRSYRSMPQISVDKLPVSLAFRRTCYKCGNLGHHAEECEFKERLCYNCKQPGHESSNCPNDRNTRSRQCYFCKEMGHIQSECPQYRSLRHEHRFQPSTPHTSSPHTIYYPHRTQIQQPQPQLRRAPSHPQFYYPHPPPGPHSPAPPMPYPLTPQQQQMGQYTVYSPHTQIRPNPPPQIFYSQGMIRQSEYMPSPVTQHYGNQLISMRGMGYVPMQSLPATPILTVNRSMVLCYTCGEQGHESRNCPRRS